MAKYTAQQLADLRAAIATGARSVNTPNMSTTFNTMAEMLQLEQIMAADVTGATDAIVKRSTSYASYSKD